MSVAAVTSGLVSSRKPDGLILSTGNLYFTSHDAAGAAVWRTAQGASPGQESVLYWEAGARFGDITFAQVGGNFFGYFFATKAGVITIKRVSLAGGDAIVLATITNVDVANSHHNLVTDGVNLYWQDDQAVRKMPIGGGPSTILDATSPNTPTAGLALRNENVIYAAGTAIRFVPKSGAITSPTVRTIVTASSRVTTLHAVLSFIYWGEQSGAVRVKGSGPGIVTIQTIAGFVPTSISTSVRGGVFAQAWTLCSSQSCKLHFDIPTGEDSLTNIGADALGVAITDAGNLFWGDAAGVHRHVP